MRPPTFTHITAVEIAEAAATALAQTRLPNLRAVKATTLDFLRAAVLQRDRPAAIVLDPPRTGLGEEVCALLARIAAPALVYVSCSPTALAADLAALIAAGYAVSELHLFDLFPRPRTSRPSPFSPAPSDHNRRRRSTIAQISLVAAPRL